eukprot:COSAG01_NODE_21734_length_887_cov_1.977157_1_plen_70_part_01
MAGVSVSLEEGGRQRKVYSIGYNVIFLLQIALMAAFCIHANLLLCVDYLSSQPSIIIAHLRANRTATDGV